MHHLRATLALFTLATGAASAQHAHHHPDPRLDAALSDIPAFTFAPEGFVPPPIHPAGATLSVVRLGDGVYAIEADRPAVDRSGFIVGDNGVLVIDAHLNHDMAREIIRLIRTVTDKPIRYLVHTNYHGDHTFGNTAFPESTTIVAHRATAQAMLDYDAEYQTMLSAVRGDSSALPSDQPRLPSLTFEKHLALDLGNRIVELHHFGRGNTAGDTVVYAPDAKAAWTGNLITGRGFIPLFLEPGVGADEYLATITNLATSLEIDHIVPGHGPVSDEAALSEWASYLSWLLLETRASIRDGLTLSETLARIDAERWLPAPDSPYAEVRPLMLGFHRLAVAQTYRDEIAQHHSR